MGEEPRQLERRIERTREELGYDVDALADKVSPSRVVGRRVERTRSSLVGLKDSVMGSAEPAISSVQEGAVDSVDAVRRRARGNPLAAGLIAFGVGWLVASMLPASDTEEELAGRLEQAVKDNAGPVTEQLKDSAQEMADHLKQPAQEAAQSVKDRATEAVQQVGQEGRSAASDVAPTSGTGPR
jgi:uncharacterized protein YjbJ (UPF0337 family)